MRYLYDHLTVEDHVALGNKLKAAWRASFRVRAAFPKNSRAAQAARRLEKALASLKSALDDDVCRLVPRDRDPRHLATHVYYGPQFVKQPQDAGAGAGTGDAFAAWVQEERAM